MERLPSVHKPLLLLLCATLPLLAQPRKVKSAWEWTPEERIAQRVALAGEQRQARIDGRQTPELLMPTELFGSIVDSLGDPDSLALTRELYDPAITAAGWKPDLFWSELHRITHAYLAAQRESLTEQERLGTLAPAARREAEAKIDRLGVAQCRLRVRALADARERFGAHLDRFLYTAVAPNVGIASTADSDEAERLRSIEGGCQ